MRHVLRLIETKRENKITDFFERREKKKRWKIQKVQS